jgi:NAD(P)-dependent dehydrogenase (short-subunit alcohol dehydrogenase family)
MKNKKAIVIGGTSGIGQALAKRLVKQNFEVTVVGRNRQVGERMTEDFGVSFASVDVSSLQQLKEFALEWREQHDQLDLLVHSADVLRTKRENSVDGFELTFATNYLSRFFLNTLLLDKLKASSASTILHIAAAGFPGKLDLDRVPPPATMSSFGGHNIGQRANDVYGLELARRVKQDNIRVLVFNPGMVDTGIRQRMEGVNIFARAFVGVMETLVKATPTETFVDVVMARLENKDTSAVLYGPKNKPFRLRRDQVDEARGRVLWEKTERLLNPFLNSLSSESQTITVQKSEQLVSGAIIKGPITKGHS